MKRNLPKLAIVGLVLCGIILGGFIYIALLQVGDNFHTVVNGEFYRSAQLDAASIARYKQQYGIKTIINLRGANASSVWYQNETAAAAANNITHVDYPMSARRGLTPQQAQDLIALMNKVEKPVLVHCRSGADRSGLAAALYLAGVKKESEFHSELQMNFIYGHLALWFIPAYGVNRTFEMLEPSLGYFDS